MDRNQFSLMLTINLIDIIMWSAGLCHPDDKPGSGKFYRKFNYVCSLKTFARELNCIASCRKVSILFLLYGCAVFSNFHDNT